MKWGIETRRTYKPIQRELQMERFVGVPHEAKMPKNSDTIHLLKRRTIKFFAVSFAIAAISLLFGRAYIIDTVN
jgi:hypothetical protein